MAQFIQPHAARVAICEALDLNPGEVRSIHISVEPDELITAHVKLFLTDEKAEALAKALKEYEVEVRKGLTA